MRSKKEATPRDGNSSWEWIYISRVVNNTRRESAANWSGKTCRRIVCTRPVTNRFPTFCERLTFCEESKCQLIIFEGENKEGQIEVTLRTGFAISYRMIPLWCTLPSRRAQKVIREWRSKMIPQRTKTNQPKTKNKTQKSSSPWFNFLMNVIPLFSLLFQLLFKLIFKIWNKYFLSLSLVWKFARREKKIGSELLFLDGFINCVLECEAPDVQSSKMTGEERTSAFTPARRYFLSPSFSLA